jgi:hypothetical protein
VPFLSQAGSQFTPNADYTQNQTGKFAGTNKAHVGGGPKGYKRQDVPSPLLCSLWSRLQYKSGAGYHKLLVGRGVGEEGGGEGEETIHKESGNAKTPSATELNGILSIGPTHIVGSFKFCLLGAGGHRVHFETPIKTHGSGLCI